MMHNIPNNPDTNKLGDRITESEVIDAILKSGYPLQTIIAGELRSFEFSVQEEWSYLDTDTRMQRNIDMHARFDFYDSLLLGRSNSTVRPYLDLLVECKRSVNPYLFFLTHGDADLSDNFPLIAGLEIKQVLASVEELENTEEGGVAVLRLTEALGLDNEPFHQTGPGYFSMSFTKCLRNGSKLEISGDEAYNSMVLPLLKSMQHLKSNESPKKDQIGFACHMVLAIGVIDAPMVAVDVTDRGIELTAVPWVRIVRHHNQHENAADVLKEKETRFAMDLVHKDYFETYIQKHVLPFAKTFCARVIRHHQELATGRGIISTLNNDPNTERYLRSAKCEDISKNNKH